MLLDSCCGTSFRVRTLVSANSFLESVAMRHLFGAIAADRHATPSSCAAPRPVGEYERAAMSLECSRGGEVLFTHEPRQSFADRQQEKLRRSPARGRRAAADFALLHHSFGGAPLWKDIPSPKTIA
jgi:hypothetical protein